MIKNYSAVIEAMAYTYTWESVLQTKKGFGDKCWKQIWKHIFRINSRWSKYCYKLTPNNNSKLSVERFNNIAERWKGIILGTDQNLDLIKYDKDKNSKKNIGCTGLLPTITTNYGNL